MKPTSGLLAKPGPNGVKATLLQNEATSRKPDAYEILPDQRAHRRHDQNGALNHKVCHIFYRKMPVVKDR